MATDFAAVEKATLVAAEALELAQELGCAALPYLATILVLAVLSGTKVLTRANAPAALGRPFIPGR